MSDQHINDETVGKAPGGMLGDVVIDNKPLHERMVDLRNEIDSMVPPTRAFTGLEASVVAKFRQTLGTAILWVGLWEKNKDYSAAINASMALGKLATATSLFSTTRTGGSNTTYDAIVHSTDVLCEQCWQAIRDAAGRIVPFER